MKRSMFGFTIVEIMTVVVVVGIIASIGVLSWNNVTTGSRDRAREADLNAWISSFDTYRARFIVNPAMPTGALNPLMNGALLSGKAYCLGSFTTTSGKCGQYTSSTATAFLPASDSSSMLTELAKIGNTPTNNSPAIKSVLAGPILFTYKTTNGSADTDTVTARFINFFEGNCPSSAPGEYTIATLPAPIALVLTGLPSGTSVHACYAEKTFSYSPT